jgi:carbonic anhydrase
MTAILKPVRAEADILAEWRETPITDLLRFQNLGAATDRKFSTPELLVATPFEDTVRLRLPPGFAIELRTAAANLKRDPFKVSWAIGVAGVRAIALVGTSRSRMTGLTGERDGFVARMIENAGWERAAAEQHFDHWSDLFAVEDPAEFLLAEASRLRARYPRIPVAALLHDATTDTLLQITG